jgi:hypothetical protein
MNIRGILPAALTICCLSYLGIAPLSVKAQNNIVIFGAGRDSTLPYTTRTKRPGARLNTYSFFAKLPSNKAVAEFQVIYPQGFRGIFDESVEIVNRQTKKKYDIQETIVDKEVGSTRYVFKEAIAAAPNNELELVVKGVSNPSDSGMYRIQAQALGTEANPLFKFLGQWLVDIYN